MKKILYIVLFFSQSIFGNTYYVSTTGDDDTGDGSVGNPWATVVYAHSQITGGDTLYMRGGTHAVNATLLFESDMAGTASDRTAMMGYPGETVILDYATYDEAPNQSGNTYAHAIMVWISGFITFKDFTVRNVNQVDDYTEVSALHSYRGYNLTYENIIVHDLGGRAFFHETPWGFGTDPDYDTTRYINCDAYNGADSLPYTPGATGQEGNQADGFKCYGAAGSVIYYTGCRAWNFSDDGWDSGTGQIIYFDRCWSFLNGHNLLGDGNGFKMGSHEDTTLYLANDVLRFVNNCIAAYNDEPGFFFLEYEDYFRLNGRMWNCVSYENQGSGMNFSNNALPGREDLLWQIYNSISYSTLDGWNAVSAPYKDYTESHNTWDDVTGFPGWEYTDTITFDPATDWIVSDSVTVLSQLSAPRQSGGSLPTLTAFKLQDDSDLIDAGVDVGLPYYGEYPDVGAFEWSPAVPRGKHHTYGGKYQVRNGKILFLSND